MEIIKVIVVDDHPIFRKGLTQLLNSFSYIKVVGEASNGEEFIGLIYKVKPDIVFMDIKMPGMNGVEATRRALEIYPDMHIIALTMFQELSYYKLMLDAGAKAFLLKDVSIEEIERAIQYVDSGESYFSPDLFKKLATSTVIDSKHHEDPELTNRESEILGLICTGLSTHDIAQTLHLSQRTVEGHRANILLKTNCKNAVELVLFAIKNKLVDIKL